MQLRRILFPTVAVAVAMSAPAPARGWKPDPAAVEQGGVVEPAPGKRPRLAEPGIGPASPRRPLKRRGAEVQSATVRVTLRGFRVDHQSYDNIVESDGRGDEVYVRADTFRFDLSDRPPVPFTTSTLTIGHNKALIGGTASDCGTCADHGAGGFRTGDTYPTRAPWEERPGGPRVSDLPMVVFEGVLSRGADAVVVIPTIWESDSDGPSPEERRWQEMIGRAVAGARPAIRDVISAPRSSSLPRFEQLLSLPIFNDGTRPIGSSRPRDVPMQVNAIILTLDSAVALAAQASTETVCRREGNTATCATDQPRPAGVLGLAFVDGHDMEGEYTLYLHVEVLPRR